MQEDNIRSVSLIKSFVDVPMCAYNHEKYISQAIEGVLSQKTNFKFRLIIGEDCSQDSTRSIIQKYLDEHPDKIKAFFHEKNLGVNENSRTLFNECNAKYIALCDGDDYWADPLKLQKQIDFLEDNLEYSICGHPVQVIDNLGNVLYIRPNSMPKEINHTNLLKGNFLTTCSVVFKNFNLTNSQRKLLNEIKFGDWPLFLFCAEKGKIGFLDTLSAVYRKHSEGTWSTSNSIKQQIAVLDFYQRYNSYTHGQFNNVICDARIGVLRRITLEYLKQRKISYSFCFYLKWAFSDKKNMFNISKFYLSRLKSTYL